MVLIPSYILADTEMNHPLIKPDPRVLIFLYGDKMQGFDGIALSSLP
jgi:hypothetical protein